MFRRTIIRDTRGLDMVEFTLLAFLIAVVAGAIMPQVITSVRPVFAKIEHSLCLAAAGKDMVAAKACDAEYRKVVIK